ncbi:uncharacterized protein F5891DRAFT_1126157 [Suillus fuscotomentosus]|uniref:Uncharacterized protein n=1 Tax=Suillus fuscotomentosus TaxID=1912939 RepID=A0AAD4HRZ8_9AGAM|nr:uncharacterized protein F5891DRAFT_1126157 [Suillus fuscotomentosus]KAG1905399.1 hypothetical protein F5891DRAFT_1126157 [Suillus fuscotomentosus]
MFTKTFAVAQQCKVHQNLSNGGVPFADVHQNLSDGGVPFADVHQNLSGGLATPPPDFLPTPPQLPPPPDFSPPPPDFSPPPPDFSPPPPDVVPLDDDEDPESEFMEDHKDLHKVIDTTQLGNVPWQCLLVQYMGEHPEHDTPLWMGKDYEVWYRDPRVMAHNMLANTTYKDFMSGDWAWQQAIHIRCISYNSGHTNIYQDELSKDLNTHGSMFIPIILGSDKTTVSVGTGNNKYYPLYASIGNVHNNVQHAHRDALVIIGFLSIPKSTCINLFHCSLSAILSTLKPAMTKYKVLRCADGHFRHIIFGLGPYIADYEEQLHTDLLVLENIDSDTLWHEFGIISILVPFTNDFPQADIHQLISFDLLHQLVKGAFKDHLVDWVLKYLKLTHGTKQGEEIMSDIDRRIAAVASFTGLWRFPDGCGFKQWMAFHVLLEFCYIARCDVITKASLVQLSDVLTMVHHYCQIFETTGTVPHFSLPHQHSMTHYVDMIRLFGAPNGLCLSITESKHIKVVKEPWRWSNKHNALGQMLLTNQWLDKLAASRRDFAARRMLISSVLIEQKCMRTVAELADEVNVPHLRRLIQYFLFSQLFPNDPHNPEDVPAASCPWHEGGLYVFNSAAATFYAPSDPSACPLWRNVSPCNDCVFVNINSDLEGMKGLEVARVKCFFSFKFDWVTYPCALVQWFDKVSDCADEDTGMWIVHPSVHDDSTPNFAIIHIDTVYRAAHLIPVYGPNFIADDIKYFHSYDAFRSFYVNKFADHHAFKIAL